MLGGHSGQVGQGLGSGHSGQSGQGLGSGQEGQGTGSGQEGQGSGGGQGIGSGHVGQGTGGGQGSGAGQGTGGGQGSGAGQGTGAGQGSGAGHSGQVTPAGASGIVISPKGASSTGKISCVGETGYGTCSVIGGTTTSGTSSTSSGTVGAAIPQYSPPANGRLWNSNPLDALTAKERKAALPLILPPVPWAWNIACGARTLPHIAAGTSINISLASSNT